MKFKPKEVLINVPAVLMFDTSDEGIAFVANINTLLHGKVKMKYEELGILGEQLAVLFYLQRNGEFQELRDSFMRLIEAEELKKANSQ